MSKTRLIVFTDLDGTLLDQAYSYAPALPALKALEQRSIPCVLCSSKTRKEIEYYRERLKNRHPFISENGGGIFIPRSYFPADATRHAGGALDRERTYNVISLGARYKELRRAIGALQRAGLAVRGFGDMTAEEIVQLTALPAREAHLAKQRDFDEPFLFEGGAEDRRELVRLIGEMGFTWTQGAYYHLMGDSNKGKAVEILAGLFSASCSDNIETVALGDGFNDLPMLQAVDRAIIIQRPDGTYDPHLEGHGFSKAIGIGPVGWNNAVLELLKRK